RIERSPGIERANVVDAVAHGSAPLQHERSIALLREKIRRRQTARTGADDNRPLSQRLFAWPGHGERRLVIEVDARGGVGGTRGERSQAGFLLRHRDLGGVDKLQRVFVAGIEGLTEDAPAAQLARGQSEKADQSAGKSGLGFVDAQTNVGNAKGHWERRKKEG